MQVKRVALPKQIRLPECLTARFGLKLYGIGRIFRCMTSPAKNTPGSKAAPEKAKSAEKQARLAEALRANLRRRKEQARDRKDDS